jgi:hypothetical protein
MAEAEAATALPSNNKNETMVEIDVSQTAVDDDV